PRNLPDVESTHEGARRRRGGARHLPLVRRRRRPVHDRHGRAGDDAHAPPRRARPAPTHRRTGRARTGRGESPRARSELRAGRPREGVTPRNTPFGQWSARPRPFSLAAMYDALRNSLTTITERQLQVIELIAAGCSNEEVGERLGISPRTAKAHCDVLRQKLGVARRRQIPRAYLEQTGDDPLSKASLPGTEAGD